jgi:hypothetical protein
MGRERIFGADISRLSSDGASAAHTSLTGTESA